MHRRGSALTSFLLNAIGAQGNAQGGKGKQSTGLVFCIIFPFNAFIGLHRIAKQCKAQQSIGLILVCSYNNPRGLRRRVEESKASRATGMDCIGKAQLFLLKLYRQGSQG